MPSQQHLNSHIVWLSALFAVILALVHLFSGKLRFLEKTPRTEGVTRRLEGLVCGSVTVLR
ncbi:hypothetical protein [Chroococcidiopsis cubana]|uniref:hypothetical protein n=1 Tax=Chroococcidiopsis cubana TaxID=171392 RepID=UPI002ACEAE34|nr:hypothetical protein [Chroococcidiopsis cubana]